MNRNNNIASSDSEAYARRLRYNFFDSFITNGNVRVATAHTKNDLVETVLFNIFRGSGQKGAAGIPVQRGPYIRPLIDVERDAVEAYCVQNDLEYVEDASNDDLRYSRNLIRKKIIPVMNHVHPGAFENVVRFAGNMRMLDQWLDNQAALLMRSAEISTGRWGYEREFALKLLHEAEQPVLMAFFSMLCGSNVRQAKLSELCSIVYRRSGKAQLSATDYIGVVSGRLVLGRMKQAEIDNQTATASMDNVHTLREGEYEYSGCYRFTAMRHSVSDNAALWSEVVEKDLNSAADYDKINKCSVFRVRQPGDWMRFEKRGITKQLRKWMNEQHIPAYIRDRLPVLANGQEVLWVYGKGFSDSVLPDKTTKTLFVIDEAISGM